MTSTPTSAVPDFGTPEEALAHARKHLAALAAHARTGNEEAWAEVALAHLDDAWPLPAPAAPDDVVARGNTLVYDAVDAVLAVIQTAEDTQLRVRALRALDAVTSALEELDHAVAAERALLAGGQTGAPGGFR